MPSPPPTSPKDDNAAVGMLGKYRLECSAPETKDTRCVFPSPPPLPPLFLHLRLLVAATQKKLAWSTRDSNCDGIRGGRRKSKEGKRQTGIVMGSLLESWGLLARGMEGGWPKWLAGADWL